MAMKPFKRAVAIVGKYTDRDGYEKQRYVTVGTLFKDPIDPEKLSLKLDAFPAGNE